LKFRKISYKIVIKTFALFFLDFSLEIRKKMHCVSPENFLNKHVKGLPPLIFPAKKKINIYHLANKLTKNLI